MIFHEAYIDFIIFSSTATTSWGSTLSGEILAGRTFRSISWVHLKTANKLREKYFLLSTAKINSREIFKIFNFTIILLVLPKNVDIYRQKFQNPRN